MRSFIDYVYYLAKSLDIWENKEVTDEFGNPVIHKMKIKVSENTTVSVCKYFYNRHFRLVSHPYDRHTEFFTLSGKVNVNLAFGDLPVDDDLTISLVTGSWLRISSNKIWTQLETRQDSIIMEVQMLKFYNALPESNHEYDNIDSMTKYQQEKLLEEFRPLMLSKFAVDTEESLPKSIGRINRFMENDVSIYSDRNRKY